jgi:hypothetical protein
MGLPQKKLAKCLKMLVKLVEETSRLVALVVCRKDNPLRTKQDSLMDCSSSTQNLAQRVKEVALEFEYQARIAKRKRQHF